MAPTLLLIRHGHTAYNTGSSPERLRGWLDIPLDEEGKRDAQRLARVLAAQPVKAIVTSDFKRSADVADAIARSTGAPVTRTRALRPWNLGRLAGRPVDTSLSFLRYYQDHPQAQVPGGESYGSFYDRWQMAIKNLLAAASQTDDGLIVAITHVRNLLATPSILTGGKASIDPKMGPRTGDGLLLLEQGGVWRVYDWNPDGVGKDGESAESETHLNRSSSMNNPPGRVAKPKPVALAKWAVLYVEGHDEPYSCTNCHMLWKRQKTCAIHGPEIIIDVITKDGEEFHPVCGLQDYGKPMDGKEATYPAKNDPDLTGLEWVLGKGTNCGGVNGGRWCSAHYAKEGAKQAFCDVLQEDVKGVDCCAANENQEPGKSISWRDAQRILKRR